MGVGDVGEVEYSLTEVGRSCKNGFWNLSRNCVEKDSVECKLDIPLGAPRRTFYLGRRLGKGSDDTGGYRVGSRKGGPSTIIWSEN